MKKILVIIVLIAAVIALYLYRDALLFWYKSSRCPATEIWDNALRRCAPVVDVDPDVLPDEGQSSRFDMSEINRVMLTLDDSGKKTIETMRKSDGRLDAEFKTEDTPVAGSVLILEEHALYRETAGDVFIPYVVNYGGSGSFVSVGLFIRKSETSLELKDSRLIGDRVIITKLVLDEKTEPANLYVRFLNRKEGESFAAAPTVPKETMLPLGDHLFEGDTRLTDSVATNYKDLITVDSPAAGQAVSSPLTVSGKARGQWYFEGSFPIIVTDWDGKIIDQGHAEAQGEWMTELYVPFKGTISFTLPPDTPQKRGAVIFKKDNPSDMREHDDSFEVPVVFR